MPYCPQCRIGTLDQNGLCVLCGAPGQPASRWRRIAESGAAALAAVFSPAVLGPAIGLALLAAYALLLRSGTMPRGAPAIAGARGVRRFMPLDPAAVMATLHADPGAGLLHLLAPAILQALIFGLILLLVLFLVRRRRPVPATSADDSHAFS